MLRHTLIFTCLTFIGLSTFGQVIENENISTYRKQYKVDVETAGTRLTGEPDSIDSDSNPAVNPPLNYERFMPDSGAVVYHLSPAMETLLNLHTRQYSGEVIVEGFRIQIYAGSELENANEARADFLDNFDETPVYQKWIPPHFRVRVGNFLDRSGAMQELATIRQVFPGAFIVPDKVKLPKFRKPIAPDLPPDEARDDDSEISPN